MERVVLGHYQDVWGLAAHPFRFNIKLMVRPILECNSCRVRDGFESQPKQNKKLKVVKDLTTAVII